MKLTTLLDKLQELEEQGFVDDEVCFGDDKQVVMSVYASLDDHNQPIIHLF